MSIKQINNHKSPANRGSVSAHNTYNVGSGATYVDAAKTGFYQVRLVEKQNEDKASVFLNKLAGRKSLMVVTPTVYTLHTKSLVDDLRNNGIDIEVLIIPVTESTKKMETVLQICSKATELQLQRNSLIVGMGGGICTDVVTLAASLYRRGIEHIRIPTTLIGQVDASIGIKGAVNYQRKKNSIGCYNAPSTVFVDPNYLKTLPRQSIRNGLAEIIKVSVICDGNLYGLLEKKAVALLESNFQSDVTHSHDVLSRSIDAMLSELQGNLYEDKSKERLVDFGHTISPLLETRTNYALSHGEAVAIDISFSTVLARALGLIDNDECNRILELIDRCELPTFDPILSTELVSTSFYEATQHRSGSLNLVVPNSIGGGTFIKSATEISKRVVDDAISELKARSPASFTNSSRKYYVADIGGTSIRTAVYDTASGNLIARDRIATPNCHNHPTLTPDALLDLVLKELITSFKNHGYEDSISHLSIAFPGPLNAKRQVIAAPTIWGASPKQPIDLLKRLRKLWPTKNIYLLNDVEAAGYRYLKDSTDSLCITTVGSGIGSKIFHRGEALVGVNGYGGEIGHLKVDHANDANICDCGVAGHLVGIASGRGSLATAVKYANNYSDEYESSYLYKLSDGNPALLTEEHLVEAFLKDDAFAVRIISNGITHLASVLANMHLSTGIESFVIYGGFASALGSRYTSILATQAQNIAWDNGAKWDSMVHLANEEDDSGLLGGGRYLQHFLGNQNEH